MSQDPDFLNLLKSKPNIAALCSESFLDDLCLSSVKVAFILCGNFKNLPDIVSKTQDAGIVPFVHIDLIDGLSTQDGAVDFIKEYTCARGIITTRSNQIRRAHALDLLAIHRYFVFDAFSLASIKKQIATCPADAVEVLPGVILSVIKSLSSVASIPLIVGGFVNTVQDISNALSAGASGISTSDHNLWYL